MIFSALVEAHRTKSADFESTWAAARRSNGAYETSRMARTINHQRKRHHRGSEHGTFGREEELYAQRVLEPGTQWRTRASACTSASSKALPENSVRDSLRRLRHSHL